MIFVRYEYEPHRSSVAASPEVACEQNDDGEQLQSSDDHEGTEVDFQARVEEGEVTHRSSVTKGCAGVGEHTDGRSETSLHVEPLQ